MQIKLIAQANPNTDFLFTVTVALAVGFVVAVIVVVLRRKSIARRAKEKRAFFAPDPPRY